MAKRRRGSLIAPVGMGNLGMLLLLKWVAVPEQGGHQVGIIRVKKSSAVNDCLNCHASEANSIACCVASVLAFLLHRLCVWPVTWICPAKDRTWGVRFFLQKTS